MANPTAAAGRPATQPSYTDRTQFDGAIFDLDGTLADTLEDLASAMNRVHASQQLPVHCLAWYGQTIGNGIRRLVSDAPLAEKRTDEAITACFAQMIADYAEHCLVKTHCTTASPTS